MQTRAVFTSQDTTTPIRVFNMTLQQESYLYKMFGVLLTKLGTPAKKQHSSLPQVRALTHTWKSKTISDRALVNHYPLYVTSICNFAVIAKGYNLFSCKTLDHDTITTPPENTLSKTAHNSTIDLQNLHDSTKQNMEHFIK